MMRPRLLVAYRDLHQGVGPTAVISKITGRFAGTIVDDRKERVFTWFAEAGRRSGLAVGQRLLGRRQRNLPRPPVLLPLHCHADRPRLLATTTSSSRQSVVGGRNTQCR